MEATMTTQLFNSIAFFGVSPVVWVFTFFLLIFWIVLGNLSESPPIFEVLDNLTMPTLFVSIAACCFCIILLPFTNFITENEFGLYEDGGQIKTQGEGLHFSGPLLQVYYLSKSTPLSCEGGQKTNSLGEDVNKIKVCRVANLDLSKFMSRLKKLDSLNNINHKGPYNSEKLYNDAPELFEVVTTTE